jgi:glycosyltransferase involved in cell wall biosynthesis
LARILHILPHRGGGGETVVDVLSRLEGFEHERAYLSAARRPLAAAPSIAARRLSIRRRAAAADLLHVIGDTSALLSLAWLRRRPAVFGTHGLHLLRRTDGALGRLVAGRLAAAVSACEQTVCSSSAELEELRAAVGSRGSLVVVHNGVPAPAEDPALRPAVRAELGLADTDVALLYLGQLESRKEPLLAVEATRRAVALGQPVVLLVAGEGPLASDVEACAGPAVRPLGFRADPERLLAAADVFVMPSAREGMALALLEAMAAGVPPLVSDGPGNPEAVGDAGVVFGAGDVAAFTEALVGLAADAPRRGRLGALARRRARDEFGIDRFAADMEAVFRAALQGGDQRS